MGVDVTLLLVLLMCGGRKIPVRLVAPNVELMLDELPDDTLSMVVLGATLEESIWVLKIWGKSWLQLGSEAWWRLTSWFMGVERVESSKFADVFDSVVPDVSLPLPLLESLLFTSIAFNTNTLLVSSNYNTWFILTVLA